MKIQEEQVYKIPEYHIDGIEDIPQKMLKNFRDCQSLGWIREPTSLRI